MVGHGSETWLEELTFLLAETMLRPVRAQVCLGAARRPTNTAGHGPTQRSGSIRSWGDKAMMDQEKNQMVTALRKKRLTSEKASRAGDVSRGQVEEGGNEESDGDRPHRVEAEVLVPSIRYASVS